MDSEYRSQLEEQLRTLRRLQHEDRMTEARYGLSADPSLKIRIEDRAQEIAGIEAQLGIERPRPAPQSTPIYRRADPVPEPAFRERITSRHTQQRQQEIEHHVSLLGIHRRNLAHYREQAKAYGGVALAPPVTRNGMSGERAQIARIKRILRDYGEDVADLAGDE